MSKKRLPRIERNEEFHFEDDTTHLWAVSYADFLMVLLSFFVIFFSTSEEQKESIIRRIIASTDADGKTKKEYQGSEGVGQGGDFAQPGEKENKTGISLKDMISQNNGKIEALGDQLVFTFPDNLYERGQLTLVGSSLTLFQSVIKSLMEYKDNVELTIIGHTDSTPVRSDRGPFLDNNFAFSATRASEALKVAAQEGFPVDALSAKGSADQKRNTRSLTLVITNKK